MRTRRCFYQVLQTFDDRSVAYELRNPEYFRALDGKGADDCVRAELMGPNGELDYSELRRGVMAWVRRGAEARLDYLSAAARDLSG